MTLTVANHDRLTHQLGSPERWFWVFCFLHLVIWTCVRCIPDLTPHVSVLEGVVWGNELQLGYHKHPFLAPWITALVSQTHLQLDWPFYLLIQMAIVTSFWAIWRLAKLIVPPWYALVAVILLEAVEFYNYRALSFNPDILSLPMWALAALTFYLAVDTQKMRWWILCGLVSGLAMMTKYVAALLLASMFFFLIFTPKGRTTFTTSGPYVALMVFLLVISPHVFWLIQNDFVTFTYVTEKADLVAKWQDHFYYPVRFFLGVIGKALIVLLFFIPFFRCQKAELTISSFDKYFVLFLGLGPLFLALAFSAVTGYYLRAGWSYAFFGFIGLLLLIWRRPEITSKALLQSVTMVLCFTILNTTVREVYRVYRPELVGKTAYYHYPAKQMAERLNQLWKDKYGSEVPYVAGTASLVKYITPYMPEKPSGYFDWLQIKSPWIDEAKMREKGAVFVWFKVQGETLPNHASRFESELELQGSISFPMLTQAEGVPPCDVVVGFLPPQVSPLKNTTGNSQDALS